VLRLLLTASSPILFTLMIEAIRSSESSVLTRATRRNIPEDGIVHFAVSEHELNASVGTFHTSLRYARVTSITISDILFDMDGFGLRRAGLWGQPIALPVWSRAETTNAMKNAVFCDVTPCGSCKDRRRCVLRFLVTANVVPSSPFLVTLVMEVIRSSESSVLTKVTQRNILEDGILHSHCSDNLKCFVALTAWAL
jgi:hypothetical protein